MISLSMFCLFMSLLVWTQHFAKISPHTPDEATGHVYAENMHGVVYLTLHERRLLRLPWVVGGAWLAFSLIFSNLLEGQ